MSAFNSLRHKAKLLSYKVSYFTQDKYTDFKHLMGDIKNGVKSKLGYEQGIFDRMSTEASYISQKAVLASKYFANVAQEELYYGKSLVEESVTKGDEL